MTSTYLGGLADDLDIQLRKLKDFDGNDRTVVLDVVEGLEAMLTELCEMNRAMTALRQPFPPEAIGKLPRIICRACNESNSKVCAQHRKNECKGCHNYITDRHIHLDYVGHAAVTDRLNQVDPTWNWRPIRWTKTASRPSTATAACGSRSPFWASPARPTATPRASGAPTR
jgi:hypothetical protein